MKYAHINKLVVSRFFTGLLCTLMALPLMAQEDDLKDLPGFIDFGDLSSTYGEPKISINIGGTLLQFVGLMGGKNNPETSKLMAGLQGIRVFGYPIDGDATVAKNKFTEVKGNLKSKGWEPIVQVNEDDEKVLIYMKMGGTAMEGMAVMTVDDEEVMFINIIGQLDPSQLGEMMENFDVDIEDALDLD
jgi:hypothetical protein